jgi:ATP-dependent Clp protease ATP-binding subunit ClpA
MLTSNAATDELTEIGDRHAGEPDEMRRTSMIVLRQAGFAPEVLNRIDRVFVFSRLRGLDVARVAALEIEAMIENYGLQVADGGIDPVALFNMMQRLERMGTSASARDLVRAIEETISDSLISARQKKARKVVLVAENGRVTAEIAT